MVFNGLKRFLKTIIVVLLVSVAILFYANLEHMHSSLNTTKTTTTKTTKTSATAETTDAKLHSTTKKWDIIYDQKLLASSIMNIHTSRYNVLAGEECTQRQPQCIVIGVSKCGTTELVDFMALHPNIVIRGQTETNFDLKSSRLVKSMPCSYNNQITVFKNSGLFHRTIPGPKGLYQFNKHLKMIVLVREPVSRLISNEQYTYFQNHGDKTSNIQNISRMPSLDNVLINEANGNVTRTFNTYKSVYDEPLVQYLKYFTFDNLLFIESRELITNPAKVLYKVETFLGLEHLVEERDFVYNNEKGFYCIRSLDDKMVCYGSDRGRTEFKDIQNETRTKLNNFYRPHNENFFKLIGTRYDW